MGIRGRRALVPYNVDPTYFVEADPQGSPGPGAHYINQLGAGVKPVTRLFRGMNKPPVQVFGAVRISPPSEVRGKRKRRGGAK